MVGLLRLEAKLIVFSSWALAIASFREPVPLSALLVTVMRLGIIQSPKDLAGRQLSRTSVKDYSETFTYLF